MSLRKTVFTDYLKNFTSIRFGGLDQAILPSLKPPYL